MIINVMKIKEIILKDFKKFLVIFVISDIYSSYFIPQFSRKVVKIWSKVRK